MKTVQNEFRYDPANNLKFEDLPKAVYTLIEKVNNLEKLFLEQYLKQKPILDDDGMIGIIEAAKLLDYTVGSLYVLVNKKAIPYYKPKGKLRFKPSELKEWEKQNKGKTKQLIDQEAHSYIISNRNNKGKNYGK